MDTEKEVDEVQLVLITSPLGEVTVISRVTDEPFFLLGIRSMMLDLVIVEEKSKEDCMKLFFWPLIEMHGALGAAEFETKA